MFVAFRSFLWVPLTIDLCRRRLLTFLVLLSSFCCDFPPHPLVGTTIFGFGSSHHHDDDTPLRKVVASHHFGLGFLLGSVPRIGIFCAYADHRYQTDTEQGAIVVVIVVIVIRFFCSRCFTTLDISRANDECDGCAGWCHALQPHKYRARLYNY